MVWQNVSGNLSVNDMLDHFGATLHGMVDKPFGAPQTQVIELVVV